MLPTVPTEFVARRARYGCFRAAATPCFRAVYDGFLPHAEAKAAVQALGGQSVMYRSRSLLPALLDGVVDRVIGLFQLAHNITGLRMVQANFLDGGAPRADGGRSGASELPLHADYHYAKHSHYAYSALLYLSHASAGDGGATAFSDELEGQRHRWEVKNGLIVQPSPGRLALFSSGAENVHASRALSSAGAERRKVVAIWFDCSESAASDSDSVKSHPTPHTEL